MPEMITRSHVRKLRKAHEEAINEQISRAARYASEAADQRARAEQLEQQLRTEQTKGSEVRQVAVTALDAIRVASLSIGSSPLARTLDSLERDGTQQLHNINLRYSPAVNGHQAEPARA